MQIVVIDIDSLRPDHLGAYGHEVDISPRIDELATDGVRFDSAYVSNSPCMPSRAAMLTGRYGLANGIETHGPRGQQVNDPNEWMRYDWMDWKGRIRDYWTLPEAFYHNRIRTCAISSFPRHRASWFYCHWHEFYTPQEPQGGTFQMVQADAVADAAEDFLHSTDEDDEFLLYMQFWDPHTPYTRPESEVEAMRERRSNANARPPYPSDESIEAQTDYRGSIAVETPGAYEETLAAYDAEIEYVDGYVGRILDVLRDLGRYDDTLVVLTADHGEEFGEHGVFCNHWSVYEGTQRVPLVVKPPNRPDIADTVRSELVTNVDFAPTFADYADIDIPEGWQGRSLRPIVEGGLPEEQWRDYVVLDHGLWTAQRAIRTKEYKLVRTYHEGVWDIPDKQLFRVREDPWEQTDVSSDETDRVGDLEAAMDTWVERHTEFDGDELRNVAREGPMGFKTIINDWDTATYL